MIVILAIVIAFGIYLFFFLKQPKFGKLPDGARLEQIKKSPNFRDGNFQNLRHTPDLTEGETMLSVLWDFLFSKKTRLKPVDKIPTIKTDLLNLDPGEDILVWFGHSSYFIQLDGKKILVDPVFSGSVSPISFTSKAFKGTDIYSVDDIPEIDYLFITHDHWDHLDYETILKLQSKIKRVICPLGVGSHLEYWGYKANIIVEKDWYEKVDLDSGFVATAVPARHFSGRGFKRNETLWVAFILQTPTMKIFLGGDGGYDNHFSEIGAAIGSVDLAILENGQYDRKWKYIHMMPEEVVQAAIDLKAKAFFPVHSSKFAIANHPWDEPLKKVTENSKSTNLRLVTPMIGEKVILKDTSQQFSHWWERIQ